VKSNARRTGIVQSWVDEMARDNQPCAKTPVPAPTSALKPAELDQDAGGGYNPDRTYPQT